MCTGDHRASHSADSMVSSAGKFPQACRNEQIETPAIPGITFTLAVPMAM